VSFGHSAFSETPFSTLPSASSISVTPTVPTLTIATANAGSSSGAGTGGLNNGLVYFWKLDETVTDADRVAVVGGSSATLTAEAYGETGGETSGVLDTVDSHLSGQKAAHATNNDSHTVRLITATDGLSLTSLPVTVAGWIKSDADPGTGYWISLSHDGSTTLANPSIRAGWNTSTGVEGLEAIVVHTSHSSSEQRVIPSGTQPSDDAWQLVAFKLSESAISISVNGSDWDDQATISGTGSNMNLTYAMVCSSGSSAGDATGQKAVSMIGVWDLALTADNLTELYNSGSGMTWPFPDTGIRPQCPEITLSTSGLPMTATPEQATLTVAAATLIPEVRPATMTIAAAGPASESTPQQATITATAATLPTIPQVPALTIAAKGFSFDVAASGVTITAKAHNALAGVPFTALSLGTEAVAINDVALGSEGIT